MPKFEKGSKEAKEWGERMRAAKMAKKGNKQVVEEPKAKEEKTLEGSGVSEKPLKKKHSKHDKVISTLIESFADLKEDMDYVLSHLEKNKK